MNAQNEMMVNHPGGNGKQPIMTSVEIAKITGKMHKHVLDSIRKQEVAWENVTGTRFRLSEYKDSSGKVNPLFELSMLECLYIGTKFKDEERAKLVLRWFQLEQENQKGAKPLLTDGAGSYPEKTVITVRMGNVSNQIYVQDGVIFAKFAPLSYYIGYSTSPTYYLNRLGEGNSMKVEVGKQQAWFINVFGYAELLKYRTDIPFSKISDIYKMYGIEKEFDDENPYTHKFTDSEILEIVQQINRKPVNKGKVMELLFNGKR